MRSVFRACALVCALAVVSFGQLVSSSGGGVGSGSSSSSSSAPSWLVTASGSTITVGQNVSLTTPLTCSADGVAAQAQTAAVTTTAFSGSGFGWVEKSTCGTLSVRIDVGVTLSAGSGYSVVTSATGFSATSCQLATLTIASGTVTATPLRTDSHCDIDTAYQGGDNVTISPTRVISATSGQVPVSAHYEREEFYSGVSTSGSVGKLGWASNNAVSWLSAESNRPGILRTTQVASAGQTFLSPNNTAAQATFLPSDTFDITWIVRPQTGGTDSEAEYRVGVNCTNSSSTRQPAEWFGIEKLLAGANWIAVARSAGSQALTENSSGVAFANNSWFKVRVRRVNGTTIGITVNSASEVQYTSNIPTAACHPWTLVHYTGAAGSKSLDHDLFDIAITGLSR